MKLNFICKKHNLHIFKNKTKSNIKKYFLLSPDSPLHFLLIPVSSKTPLTGPSLFPLTCFLSHHLPLSPVSVLL